MKKSVGVFIIHGMGMQKEEYARELIEDLRARLGDDADRVAFEPCHWAGIVQKHQDTIWSLIDKRNLDAKEHRQWVIGALGDPVMYLSGYFRRGQPVYGAIHRCVSDTLVKLGRQIAEAAPLVVLAHSLGSVIMSNYIWDEQHPNRSEADQKYETTGSLTKLITFGCNIPLFLPPVETIEGITFPHDTIPAHLRPKAEWINVYDPDDLLGYPLRGLWSPDNVRDVALNVGPVLVSDTPLAHNHYAKSRRFQEMVVEAIADAGLRRG